MLVDPVTKSLLLLIESNGFKVSLSESEGKIQASATDIQTKETFIIRGDDAYQTAVLLAQKVGIDLMDG